MYLSWVIPALNEEKRIEKTLREVDQYLRSKNFAGGYEIIVVDSSSQDRTEEIVLGLRKDIAGLRLISLPRTGKGAAVRKGMLDAAGEYRIFSDADNSTAPEYFDAIEKQFQQGFDVSISSRNPKDVPGAKRDVKEPWYREILGNLGNWVIQIFGVWGIWDTQNGFKACTKKATEDIFSRAKMTGFSFDIEMLALAKKLGYKIGIIPIHWKFDPDSKVTLSAYIKVFIDVFKIRWNLMTGAYKK